MKYNFIGIEEAAITGSINSILTVRGRIKKDKYKLKVIIDDKDVEFENISQGDPQKFCIKANIPKDAKKIKVYAIIGNEECLIYKTRTNRIRRLFSGIIRKFKNFFKRIGHFFHVIFKAIRFFWREYHFLVPPKLIPKYLKDFKTSMNRGKSIFYNPLDPMEYRKWLKTNEEAVQIKTFKYNPLISIITPVYNVEKEYLKECIESVINQSYDNWELCLVDDCSKNKETIETLKEYEKVDKRIKVKYRKENGNISKASNDGIEMSKGEFIALLDNDDVLSKNALYFMVEKLNEDKNLDFIYSDEDKLDKSGNRCTPHFKPDFSPDTLLSLNYICHFTMIRKKLIEKVKGFEVGLEGAQDYDLFLKVTEKTNKIAHIPRILYHWRMIKTSTSMSMSNKSYATNIGKKVLENALKRRKIDGEVIIDEKSGYYRIKYNLKKEPLVSIIIPTRDYADITRTCIESIYEKTTYKNFEIILANNNSVKQETFDLFEEMKKKHKNFKVVDVNIEFNYSRINNIAVKESKGEIIVLLNNDTEVITPEWLTEMVGYASQEHVGTVGPKLLYEDETIQHAGVILGLGGVASHAYIGYDKDELGLYGRLSVPYNYSANTAACLAVKRSIYEKVNGLEEDLMVAYNDIDFNIKVLKEGYYNVFLPQVELTHYESKSRGLDTTNEKYERFLTESKYMYDKWDKTIKDDCFYNKNFSKNGWFMLDK